MVRVKICGITSIEDARASIDAGADMLGFNFYRPSPRFIEPGAAREIIEGLRDYLATIGGNVMMIGVLVNEPSPESAAAIATNAGMDGLQLHGDESPEFCREVKATLGSGFVVKALRPGSNFDPEAASRYEVDAIMLDGFHAQVRGGSGTQVDWVLARRTRELVPKLFLAGGLSPENVARAIDAVQPFAVDACSSLESKPGVKDHDRVREFVRATRTE